MYPHWDSVLRNCAFFCRRPGLANPGTDFGSASRRRLYPLLNSKPHEGLKNEHLRCKNVLTFSKKFLWKEFNFLKLAFRLPLHSGCAAGTFCEQRQGKRKTISKTSIKKHYFHHINDSRPETTIPLTKRL